MIFAWIKDRLEEPGCQWPITVVCETLEVSRSGYYAWRDRAPSDRQKRQAELLEHIEQAYEAGRHNYGSPRVAFELKEQGVKVCENTVAKLMRQAGLAAKVKRRYVPQTTDSGHDCPVAPNRLDQDFAAELPDRRWTADITYVPTDEGWLYLAVVMDLYSRRIVGWSMRPHLRAELACEALEMALRSRRPDAGLLHHSDRGVQYACEAYRQMLSEARIEPSMSRTGNCYDNAVTESFFSTLKTELVNQEHYQTHEQARQSLFEWIEVFYNRQRRHSALGYLSPEAFEAKLN
jgi:transposase InsO family protein